ncbi:MAG: hypothetical protein JSV49_02210 [Thermoplasmata archaeon]|nr:MAG: hypothetical protein JSV49_02210 [Thermoplasmata archaeon]
MAIKKFKEVFCADEKMMDNPFTPGFWQVGSLEIVKNRMKFKGKILTHIDDIEYVSLVKEKFHWGIMVIFIIPFLILFFLFTGVIPKIIGFGCLFASFGPILATRTKWVLVEYIDNNDNLKKVYFKKRTSNQSTEKLFYSLGPIVEGQERE